MKFIKITQSALGLIGLSLLLVQTIVVAAVYKQVDAQGNVTYTNIPQQAAKELVLPPITIVPSVKIPEKLAESEVQNIAPNRYVVSFSSPQAGQMFYRADTAVPVQVVTQPFLHVNDRIEVALDGRSLGFATQHSVLIQDLNPGEHTLLATVVGADGQIKGQVNSQFYIFLQRIRPKK